MNRSFLIVLCIIALVLCFLRLSEIHTTQNISSAKLEKPETFQRKMMLEIHHGDYIIMDGKTVWVIKKGDPGWETVSQLCHTLK